MWTSCTRTQRLIELVYEVATDYNLKVDGKCNLCFYYLPGPAGKNYVLYILYY